jgi:salicylate hydroxylase
MEDGAVIGKLLGKHNHIGVPKALKLFQQLRKARGEAIARETFKQVPLQIG